MFPLVFAASLLVPSQGALTHRDAAMSCQLQRYNKGQHELDPDGVFQPIVIRFDHGSASDKPIAAGEFEVYDPDHLLDKSHPTGLYLRPGSIEMTTDVDGPAGILSFTARNFDVLLKRKKSSNLEKGEWTGSIALTAGAQSYQLIGPCYYSEGVSSLDSEALVIRKAK